MLFMFMKDSKNLIGVCKLVLYTLVSLFICYNIVMLSEETETEVAETGLWFVKVIIVAAFVVLNVIGWTTTLPEKEQKN